MNNATYAREWKRLENSSAAYWQILSSLPEETLKSKPADDKWSILQLMEHLVGVESSILLYLKRKNYSPLQSKSFLPQGVRAVLLTLALKSPLKFKVPNVEGISPSNTTAPQQLINRWHKTRGHLADYLEKVPEGLTNKPMFRHPTAGTLNLHQTLQFLAEHLEHHRRQLKALLEGQEQHKV